MPRPKGVKNKPKTDLEQTERDERPKPWLFQPGDPRINRNGPGSGTYRAIKRQAQQLAEAFATDSRGNPVMEMGERITFVEAILLGWARSSRIDAQELFLRYAYGAIPTQVNLAGADGEQLTIGIQAKPPPNWGDVASAMSALAPPDQDDVVDGLIKDDNG